MKKKAEESSGGPSNNDQEGDDEDETNELKDVILPKLAHEVGKLDTFFEEVDDRSKKLRPPQFLQAEIENCIGKMDDLKDDIQVGN